MRGTGRNQSTTINHGRFRGGVGSSVLQGAGFINVYSNPVISFDRATSRGVRVRRQKKKLEQSQSLLPDSVYKDVNEFDTHKQSYISAQNSTEEVPFPKDSQETVDNKNA